MLTVQDGKHQRPQCVKGRWNFGLVLVVIFDIEIRARKNAREKAAMDWCG